MTDQKNILKVGASAPEFCLEHMNDENRCLNNLHGKWVVLYFYPKDNTSGCTIEAIEFTKARDEFEANNAVILGVSPDSKESHCRFSEKQHLHLDLLSDTGHNMIEKYGVWQQKSMYGRNYWGIVRTTYLIDPNGIIVYIWDNVKVAGHVEAVKNKLLELTAKKH